MYYSETGKVKPNLTGYCKGIGLDIGCGLEKIVPSAIGIDYMRQYDREDHPVSVANFIGSWEDYFNLHKDKVDYIYSSHLIEDYDDPYGIIVKWVNFIKKNGFLILVLPIETIYRQKGENCNSRHKHMWNNSTHFIDNLFLHFPELIQCLAVVDNSIYPVGEYSFFVVFKVKKG